MITYNEVQNNGKLITRSENGNQVVEWVKYKGNDYFLKFINGMLVEFRNETTGEMLYEA